MPTIEILTRKGVPGAYGDLLSHTPDDARIVSMTTSKVVMTAEFGSHDMTVTFRGQGFGVDGYGVPNRGTITGYRVDVDGAGVSDTSGFRLPVAGAVADIRSGHIPLLALPWLIEGNVGPDQVTGLDGNETMHGAAGNDTLSGAGGKDWLYGDGGADLLGGDAGADHLFGGAGRDQLSGGAGKDTLSGGDGDDRLVDTVGNNRLAGDAGDDSLTSGSGRDTLSGGTGADWLSAGSNADRLTGNGGNDVLLGGFGDDTLSGGSGGDRLTGGAGRDYLTGGVGRDRFIFTADSGSARDRITDFSRADGDRIDLSGLDDGRLTFRGSGIFTDADQVRVTGSGHSWTVSVNLDHDRAAEIVFTVLSTSKLTAGDFYL